MTQDFLEQAYNKLLSKLPEIKALCDEIDNASCLLGKKESEKVKQKLKLNDHKIALELVISILVED